MFNFNKKAFKKFDFTLLLITIVLCIYGIVILYSATLSFETTRLVKTQTIATLIGFIVILLLVLMDYQFLGKLYIPIYIVSNVLLLAVLFMGIGNEEWGARSWLKIGPLSFQPAEFVKIGLVVSLAKFIENNHERINEPLVLLKVLVFAFIPVLLILKQPDAGTAMVFVFFIAAMLFVAGLDWKYIGSALAVGLLSLPIIWFKLGDFQKNRIFNFLDPERDPTGTGYQAITGKIAIGSGKFWGRGLFKGAQNQFKYIPEKQTDFIFAVIGEELGFVGGFALIVLYFFLLMRLIKIARESDDLFGSLMVVGFAAVLLFHIFENIGMTIGLMPITGIPLPFVSHGGTFQLINLIFIGIALSVGVQKDDLSF